MGAITSGEQSAQSWYLAAMEAGRSQSSTPAEAAKWEAGKRLFLDEYRGFVDRKYKAVADRKRNLPPKFIATLCCNWHLPEHSMREVYLHKD